MGPRSFVPSCSMVLFACAAFGAGCGSSGSTPGATWGSQSGAGASAAGGSSGSAAGANGGSGASAAGGGGAAGSGAVGGAAAGGATGTTTTTPTGPYCGDGHVDPGEECDDGNQNKFDGCTDECKKVMPISAPKEVWTYIKVPGSWCMNGDTSGFGVSLNPDSKNVMLYLEGGGACFNDSCDFSALNVPFVPPADGIFNRLNPGNPVKDWNMVYVPYCTGDIYSGDKDSMLGGQVRHFHGYRNIEKFLEQWVPTFKDADNVLLTGISAGGFGAGLNAGQVADAFGPGHQMITIDDSGPPLSNKVIAPCLQQVFRDVWGLDGTFIKDCGADCPDKTDFATGWLAHVMKTYPNMRFGVFSNTQDLVIRTFMGFGWCDGKYDSCMGTAQAVPGDAYTNDLLALRSTYVNRAGTYYLTGFGHTVLRSPSFWATIVNGHPLSDWVTGVIQGKVEQVGP